MKLESFPIAHSMDSIPENCSFGWPGSTFKKRPSWHSGAIAAHAESRPALITSSRRPPCSSNVPAAVSRKTRPQSFKCWMSKYEKRNLERTTESSELPPAAQVSWVHQRNWGSQTGLGAHSLLRAHSLAQPACPPHPDGNITHRAPCRGKWSVSSDEGDWWSPSS